MKLHLLIVPLLFIPFTGCQKSRQANTPDAIELFSSREGVITKLSEEEKNTEILKDTNNGKYLHEQALMYAGDHDSKYPESLGQLVEDDYMPASDLAGTKSGFGAEWQIIPNQVTDSDAMNIILIWDRSVDGERMVVRNDGTIDRIPDKEFQEKLQSQLKGD